MTTTSDKKDISALIKENSQDGRISCAMAFKLVQEHAVFPDILGMAIDDNKIKIYECQLGLFGHNNNKKVKPAESVSTELEDVIYSYLEDGKLPCAAAWNIAKMMNMSKLDIACACEKIKIKIYKCQLGAF